MTTPYSQMPDYLAGRFSVTLMTELRDGTSQAVTVEVDAAKLSQAADDPNVTEYEHDVHRNVIQAFSRLLDLWCASRPKELDDV